MSSVGASPFSLRPWPTGDKKPKNLGEFIALVNAERGGFRNVTEAQLREEVQAKNEGRVDSGNSSAGDGESDSDDDADGAKSKTIVEARDELLRNLETAHQSAMLSLDFVSLLLSKEMPNQANATLSPALRDLVGFGVLGASKHHDSNVTPARVQEDLSVAAGWRLMGNNKMVDSVVESAERLEKEISLETKYWADILAVTDSGWKVASLPLQPHTLGVRYGFSEAAEEFRNSSIAPLRRDDDGSVLIEGFSGSSKRLRAVVERNGQVTGRSHLPGRVPNNAPLQERVLEARNTIFARELWYEINKEARTLLSSNVCSANDSIIYDLDATTKIILTLDDLEEPDASDNQPDSKMADAVVLGLQFLLIFSHRMTYFKRTQTTKAKAGRTQGNSILRSLVSRLAYDNACGKLIDFLTELQTVLRQAGLSDTNFIQSFMPPSLELSTSQINQLSLQHQPRLWRATPSESLIINLAQLLELSAELTITPRARVALRGKNFVIPTVSTQFMINLPGSSTATAQQQQQQQKQADPSQPQPAQTPSSFNPLEDAYPPYDRDAYPDVREAIYYIRQAAIRAVVDGLTDAVNARLGRDDDITWAETMHGATMSAPDGKELGLDIPDSSGGGAAAPPAIELWAYFQWLEGSELKTRQMAWGEGHHDNRKKLEDVAVNFFRS